jgi:tRNA(fMet)-specific endonuclease VapC
MTPRYLLDTDICIYVRKRRPLQVLARFESLDEGSLAISVITYGELLYGAAKSTDPIRTAAAHDRFFATVKILPMPVEAGPLYGAALGALSKEGNIIGSNDLWIAAHAMASDLILVTNNEREFKRVPGLKFENWAK